MNFKISRKDTNFLKEFKRVLKQGEKTLTNGEETFDVIEVVNSKQFPWHQRTFPKGILLQKKEVEGVKHQIRIFFSEEELKSLGLI